MYKIDVYTYICQVFAMRASYKTQKYICRILLALDNIWNLNIILSSWSTSVKCIDVAHAADRRNYTIPEGSVELLHGYFS